MQPTKQWQFWIDRGGTFTDVVARAPNGELISHKLLSENPEQYSDAAIAGIHDLLDVPYDAALPTSIISAVKMGTTVATNALLERDGAPLALFITQGFADALRIGYQNRPRLFDLKIELPTQLYQEVIEVDERIGANGQVVRALSLETTKKALQAVYDSGIRSIAVALMHAYRYPAHELAIAEQASAIGFTQISLSHQASPLIKLIGRGDTCVADAYLSPILRHYVDKVASKLEGTRLFFMQSNGGLTDASQFAGKDSILSGPAGGIVGAVQSCAQAGHQQIIGFDMGGTSTDVSHYNGTLERTVDSVVAGVRIRAPMMQIHTVAAGGGSLLNFDGQRFRVGPESAGANPGPTCYRNGGPLTVTDCNLLLGKLQPDYFPQVFGKSADLPLDRQAVIERFAALTATINKEAEGQHSAEQVAEGFLRVAVDNMANAIKKISTQRGYDVGQYTLCSFGGAGGQHACAVADALGMKQITIHPQAGVLSALGMGLADLRSIEQLSVESRLTDTLLSEIENTIQGLKHSVANTLTQQQVDPAQIRCELTAHLKYAGTDTSLEVQFDDASAAVLSKRFAEAHHTRYGFLITDTDLVLEAISAEASGGGYNLPTAATLRPGSNPQPLAEKQFFTDGKWRTAKVYQREQMGSGQTVEGPAIIIEKTGTNVIEPGWRAEISELGNLELSRFVPLAPQTAVGTQVDPIMLEVFNNLFMSIAEQMGATLENTSYSVNVKERLDFSCAIFDAQGDLVANAPHVPVHLGSMGECVKAVMDKFKNTVQRSDVFISNAPYGRGTHLPDITVITPCFDDQDKLLFIVASRGHHADIGGISPGSMPANSTHIDQEGALFDALFLVKQGEFLDAEIRKVLSQGPYPARNPEQNMADLKAQIAANATGIREMQRIIKRYGETGVCAYMQHVQDNAEESVRRVIDSLEDGEFELTVDDVGTIAVAIRVDRNKRQATIDFSGSSPQLRNNFNAPRAICHAAVLYVFRTLVKDDIPLNQGCMKPLKLIIPSRSLLDPQAPAAVVAGNVETSQWVTNALYGALGVMAAAQGTMNNFTFGNETHQYYETIAGGTGAGPDFAGCTAVQSHMTNSRLTDPEVLEWRFPVRLEEFSIRAGSGGAGLHTGGDGVIRKLRFLEAMDASILSSHRQTSPFGLMGGEPAKPGKNYVQRANGSVEQLAATASSHMKPGDLFIIETPGGGGYGNTDAAESKDNS